MVWGGSDGGAVAVHSLIVVVPLHPLAVRNLHLGETVSTNPLIHRLLNLLELVLANLLPSFGLNLLCHRTALFLEGLLALNVGDFNINNFALLFKIIPALCRILSHRLQDFSQFTLCVWYILAFAHQFDLPLGDLDDLGLDAALLVRLFLALLLAAEAQLLLAFGLCHR